MYSSYIFSREEIKLLEKALARLLEDKTLTNVERATIAELHGDMRGILAGVL